MKQNKNLKKSKNQGFTLIEMMIAVVLGLVLLLAVTNIFIASNKTIQSTQLSNKIQESQRLSLELLNRELREAGGNACSSSIEIGSAMKNQTGAYWTSWKNGLFGYDGSAATPGTAFGSAYSNRISGTPAIDLYSAVSDVTNVSTKMATGTDNLAVDNTAGYASGDIVFACDTSVGFLFRINSISGGALSHADSTSATGNCSRVFSYTDSCNNSATGYMFDVNATVAKVNAVRWYIGQNKKGTRSLFRAVLAPNALSTASSVSSVTEVASGVQSLNVEYLQQGAAAYTNAAGVTDWGKVASVKIIYTFSLTAEGLSSKEKTITRGMSQVVALRNRQSS